MMLTQLQALVAAPVSQGSALSFLLKSTEKYWTASHVVGFVLELLQDSITVSLDAGTFGFCIFCRAMKSDPCLSLNTKLAVGT